MGIENLLFDDGTKALWHIEYEVQMMTACTVRLRAVGPGTDRLHAILYLEGQLLHARNLYALLVPDEHRTDDMHRTDYQPGGWNPRPAEVVERLKARVKDIHKHLAHLTLARVGKHAEEWDYDEIADDVLTVFAAWLEDLDQEQGGPTTASSFFAGVVTTSKSTLAGGTGGQGLTGMATTSSTFEIPIQGTSSSTRKG